MLRSPDISKVIVRSNISNGFRISSEVSVEWEVPGTALVQSNQWVFLQGPQTTSFQFIGFKILLDCWAPYTKMENMQIPSNPIKKPLTLTSLLQSYSGSNTAAADQVTNSLSFSITEQNPERLLH